MRIAEPPADEDMASLFRAACLRFAERPAYRLDGAWITYGDCADRVARLAAALHALAAAEAGEERGTQPVIAALLPNGPELLELFFAAALARAILFPLNHRNAAAEIAAALETSGARILVAGSAFPQLKEILAQRAPQLRSLVRVGPPTEALDAQALAWEELPERAASHALPAPRAGDFLQGFGTSGTTGRSKTVLHTHRNVRAHALASIAALGLDAGQPHCWGHFGPMFHVGDAAFVWIGLLLGARHVFHGNQLRMEGVAQAMADDGVTIVKLVPSMLHLMCASERLGGLAFPKLQWILTGGAALDPDLARRAAARFGCAIIQGYGMTEATCHIAFRNEATARPGEGMRPLPGLDLRILRDDVPAAAGEVGEIALRGETIFAGYLDGGRLDTTRAAGFTADGFFRSGDLGFLDAAGGLHVVGRSKDMINVGGENVFAWEVEQAVADMPAVLDCAALAMPDPVLGEVVELAVVLGDAAPDAAALRARCRARLAPFKVPRRVHVLDALPRTATGKVQKAVLAQRLAAGAAAQAGVPQPTAARDDIASLVAEVVNAHLRGPAGEPLDRDLPLFDAGLDSLAAAELIAELEARLGRTLPETLLYDHPSIAALAAWLAAEQPAIAATPPPSPEPVAAAPEPDATPRATAPAALAAQAALLLVKPAILAAGIAPVLLLFDLAAQRLGSLALILTGPLWLALALLGTLGAAAAILRATRGGPKSFPLWSAAYFRWLLRHHTLGAVEFLLGMLRGTDLLNHFYTLCGARIGPGVRLETASLRDPDLLRIGAGSVVGRDVILQPALFEAGRITLRPVEIGAGCFIAPNASLLGGAQVADGVSVGPLVAVHGPLAAPPAPRPSAPGNGPPRDQLLHLLACAYAASLAIAAGLLVCAALVHAAGDMMPSPAALLLGRHAGPVPLSFFLGLALALTFVMPAAYFGLVVALRRLILAPLLRRAGEPAPRHRARRLYMRLIDLPFFGAWLRLTVTSHVTGWNYALLGARIGRRPFLAAPYIADPELFEMGDGAMVAGSVALHPVPEAGVRPAPIRIADRAVVAHACVLEGGAHVAEGALLGDLSTAGAATAIPAGAVASGAPPRLVGRSAFLPDRMTAARYALLQSVLVLLQIASAALGALVGFALAWALVSLLATHAPALLLWLALPLLLLLPGLVPVLLLPAIKRLVLGRVAPGEHAAFGWTYIRWVLLESLIMQREAGFLPQLHGTLALNLLWRALGARVGAEVCLFASSLGCEFDLKSIGARAIMQPQSRLFAHSIAHHVLSFQASAIGEGANIGPLSIVESGAMVPRGQVVGAHVPVHARHGAASDTLPLNLHAFEVAARARLPGPVFDYFAGGAEDGRALRRNRRAYGALRLRPRVLVDVAHVSTQIRLLGRDLAAPLLIAPSAMHRLAHPAGEAAVAQAAAQHGIGMVLSMLSTTPLEEVAQHLAAPRHLKLFQLYALRDHALMERLVARAEAVGYDALVVTVDAPVSGRREADLGNHLAFAEDVVLPHLGEAGPAALPPLLRFEALKDPSLDWAGLARLRAGTKLPVWLKGVLREDDVMRACDAGCGGIILSNHGGRQLDAAISPLEALPAARQAVRRAGRTVPLLVDGGVRRGSDILKAVALGADAVLIGRPALWGLAVAGQAGVAGVLHQLQGELALTMRLCGCTRIEEITADLLAGPDRG